jgi:hypothetical protein
MDRWVGWLKIGEKRNVIKFRDLFLPKLAHSDPKVRLRAVAALGLWLVVTILRSKNY